MEIIPAISVLSASEDKAVFTVRDVYRQMTMDGTHYAAATVSKTMQRMKVDPQQAPFVRLERSGRRGFRIVDVATPGRHAVRPASGAGFGSSV